MTARQHAGMAWLYLAVAFLIAILSGVEDIASAIAGLFVGMSVVHGFEMSRQRRKEDTR